MAKIQIASDLHLEFLPTQADKDRIFCGEDVHADILVLAGDLANNPKDLLNFLGTAKHIIIVLGNHEYYGHNLDRIEVWKKTFEDYTDVHVMDNEVIEIPEHDIRIIASTLWSDLAEGKHAEMCKVMISDFHVIRGMSIDTYLNLHEKARDYVEHALKTPYSGKTVVVTHHAPSWKSQHPKYAASGVAGLFCSNLEQMMLDYEPELWIHGHTHDPWDYKVGKTRVICNPAGYLSERNIFEKDCVVTV